MDQPQLSLNQILNTLKQKSHKNSQTQLSYKPQSDISNNYKNQSQQDEQLLIRQSDLRSILQKMLYQIQQKNILLQEKQKQNKDCLRLLHKHQLLIQQYKLNLQNKQKIYKKNMEEMEYMLNKQKKQKEILILDYNWAKNKNKEQLKQIQKIKNNNMKQLISNQAQYKIAANEPSYRIISKKKQQSNEKKLLITPGKQDGKSLDSYIMKYSQSVDSGISQTNNINSNNRQLQKLRLNTNEVEKDGIINCNKNQASTMIMNKNSISQKDRLINMLGQKCIALESQLQKLMKRYLGQIVITTNSNSNKDSNSRQFLPSQPESISQFSQYSSKEGLVRKGSDVQLSGAFKIQEEDF